MFKKIGSGLLVVIVALLAFVYSKANRSPYNVEFSAELPSYERQTLDHNHNYNGTDFLPVIGSAVVDVNNDGVSEIILGGGENQSDMFFGFSDGGLKSIGNLGVSKAGKDVTYGISVIDIDSDGDNDLLFARESGGHKCLNNSGQFSCQPINLHLNEESRPISYALGDINKDGYIDLYVSAYLTRSKMEGQTIFKQENYGGTSKFLFNNGDNTFRDATKEVGLHYVHNAFVGVFIDIDRDLDLDLVVAHDTGEVKTWKNNDGQFEDYKNPFSGAYGYPMGLAVGDYDSNSYPDFYFSNIGSTVFEFMGRGDLDKSDKYYKTLPLFKNNGNFDLVDAAEEAKVADYEFSWGAVFADLNNDSKQDIILAENYVDFPFHLLFKLPGRVLMQNDKGEFASVEAQLNAENRNYEISPLTVDFNNDGVLDQVRANLAGKSIALISKAALKNKFLKVQTPNTAPFFGAKFELELSNGKMLYDDLVSGEGLGSDQDHIIHFGLKDLTAKSLSVTLINGKKAFVESISGNKLVLSAADFQ